MGDAEEEVCGAAGVGALNFAEDVGGVLAVVEWCAARGVGVLGEHHAEGVDGLGEVGGCRGAGAGGGGEFAVREELEAFLAGEEEGELFEGPVEGCGDTLHADAGVLEEVQGVVAPGGVEGWCGRGHEKSAVLYITPLRLRLCALWLRSLGGMGRGGLDLLEENNLWKVGEAGVSDGAARAQRRGWKRGCRLKTRSLNAWQRSAAPPGRGRGRCG